MLTGGYCAVKVFTAHGFTGQPLAVLRIIANFDHIIMKEKVKRNWIKISSRIIGTFLLALILGYFLPSIILNNLSINSIISNSYLITTFIFLIPSVGSWLSKKKYDIIFLIFNIIGIVWTTFWFALLISTPQFD
jgi:hypothetical protein